MHLDRALFLVMRNSILLVLAGVGIVLLGGLLVSMLWAFFVFFLVGALVWMPLHSWVHGRGHGLPHHWSRARAYCRRVADRCRPRLVSFDRELTCALDGVRTFAGRARTFLVEVTSGAIVGGLLAFLFGQPVAALSILTGAGAGAAVGVVVALQRIRT
jgi:hypothetical protein